MTIAEIAAELRRFAGTLDGHSYDEGVTRAIDALEQCAVELDEIAAGGAPTTLSDTNAC